VPKTKLVKREAQICARLKAARERLKITQEACAAELGIERSTLSNYEYAKTPVRFDVALRFCRQMVVSEEWLATGKFGAMRVAAKLRGVNPSPKWDSSFEPIFFRHCLDLAAEKEFHSIPPGSLFSAAYDHYLAPVYQKLAAEFYYWPRIVLSNIDERELGATLMKAHLERFLMLVGNEALGQKRAPWDAQRQYIRAVFEASTVLFSFYLKSGLDDAALQFLSQKIENAAQQREGRQTQPVRGGKKFLKIKASQN